MAKKNTTAQGKRTSKPQRAASATKSKRAAEEHRQVDNSDLERDRQAGSGAPIEHFRGERTTGKHTGDAGSVDEETLDRDAPYNQTYGRDRTEADED